MDRRLPLIFATLLLCSPSHGAGDGKLDRATLRDLKAVNVIIDPVADDLQKEGLTQSALRSRLEEYLSHAHITVNTAAPEFLAIRVTSVRAGRGPYAVSMTIGVYQPVVLSRAKDVHTSTQTWEVETVLMAEPKLLYRAAMESLDDLASRFVTAYRTVNPEDHP